MNKSNFSTLFFFCVSISLNKVPKVLISKELQKSSQKERGWWSEGGRKAEREKERSNQLKKRKSNV